MNLNEITNQLKDIQGKVDKLKERELEIKNIVDIVVGEIGYQYKIYEDEPYLSSSDYDDEVTVRLEVNEACIDVDDILEKVESELESQQLDDEVEELNEGTGTNETEVELEKKQTAAKKVSREEYNENE